MEESVKKLILVGFAALCFTGCYIERPQPTEIKWGMTSNNVLVIAAKCDEIIKNQEKILENQKQILEKLENRYDRQGGVYENTY